LLCRNSALLTTNTPDALHRGCLLLSVFLPLGHDDAGFLGSANDGGVVRSGLARPRVGCFPPKSRQMEPEREFALPISLLELGIWRFALP